MDDEADDYNPFDDDYYDFMDDFDYDDEIEYQEDIELMEYLDDEDFV